MSVQLKRSTSIPMYQEWEGETLIDSSFQHSSLRRKEKEFNKKSDICMGAGRGLSSGLGGVRNHTVAVAKVLRKVHRHERQTVWNRERYS